MPQHKQRPPLARSPAHAHTATESPCPLPLQPTGSTRSRFGLALGCVAVIALGLASRKFPWLFPACLGKYPGDALWALMVFLGWSFLKPRAATRRLAALAFATACLIEGSQLYQAPWINAVRSTTLGHLVLGSTFAWTDIAAYAAGIALGALLDAALRRAFARTTD